VIQLLFALAAFTFVGLKLYKAFAKDFVSFRRPGGSSLSTMAIRPYLEPIPFFRKLSAQEQQIFLERVAYFLENKDFQGMEGLMITDEIRSVVAASAVQISFRLPVWKFPSFHLFRIYPERFYSNLFRRYLKGGAGHTGQIWFSLQDYREGFADPENGINLGLHEMAHAVIIEMKNGNLDHDFVHAYEDIEKLATDRIPKIRSKQFTYLREYAGTNEMEFIAVTTEYFFEQPEKLRNADEELYNAFCALYRTQPLPPRTTAQKITPLNYEEVEEVARKKRNYRFSRWHWSLTLVLIGIFFAPVVLIYQLQEVALSFGYAWLVAFTVFLLSAALLYKPIVKSGALGATQFWLCHFFGLWPLVLVLFFAVNNHLTVWEQGEIHRVEKVYWQTDHKAVVVFTDKAFPQEEKYREVTVDVARALKEGDYIVVVTQFGPLGVPVYGKNRVVNGGSSKPHQ
jgi:Mlc titration factor MtfA (ptsG expression regulator)